MRQHDRAAARFIVRGKRTADGGGDAESIEERRGGWNGENAAGGAVACENSTGVGRPCGGRHGIECARVTAEFLIIGVDGEQLGESFFAGAGDPDGDEAVGILVGQRAEEDRVYDAEDGSGGSDA
jgi:hypothetical protein